MVPENDCPQTTIFCPSPAGCFSSVVPIIFPTPPSSTATTETLDMGKNASGKPASPTVAIIGTGFGGLGLAIRLKQAGFENFTLFEKAADVGGVWRDNSYPGAACDVPSH